MSAEEYGQRLLKEVEVTTMDDILRELRFLQNEEHDNLQKLGIPSIDRLLQRTVSRGHDVATGKIKGSDRVRRYNDVIEITSISPGAGKTHLLYLIAGLAVLPQAERVHQLRGMNSAIIVFDTDDRFDVERFKTIMRSYVQRLCIHSATSEKPDVALGAEEEESIKAEANLTSDELKSDVPCAGLQSITDERLDELVRHAFRHVHIFRPRSLQNLLTTLASLETYLLDISGHLSGARRVSAIIIDNASSFYWQHRAEEDANRLRKLQDERSTTAKTGTPLYTQVLRALKDAQRSLDCNVVYTTYSNPPFKDGSASHGRSGDPSERGTSIRPLLPATWFAYPTTRILLHRARVARFAVGLGVQEAWADRDMRWEAVKRGQFVALSLDSDGSSREVLDFSLDAQGVSIAELDTLTAGPAAAGMRHG